MIPIYSINGTVLTFVPGQTLDGNQNFHGLSLPGAVLNKQYLSFCDFSGCTLTAARFRGAYLLGSKFRNANCRLAFFVDVISHDNLCEGASFQQAKLGGSLFTGSKFIGCNMRAVQAQYAEMMLVDFTNADLTGANFSGTDLQMSTFTGATLTNCNFTDCNLRQLVGVGTAGDPSTFAADLIARGAIITGAEFGENDFV